MSEPAATLFPVPSDDVSELSPEAATIGTIGEAKAIAKLLELGHAVAIPVVDDGVDLVVDYRLRVQVKTCSKAMPPRPGVPLPYYGFSTAGGTKWRRGTRRLTYADFVICHVLSDELWWVIPSAELRAASIQVTPGSRYHRYRDAWDVLHE